LTILSIMYGFTALPAFQGIIFITIGMLGIYIFVRWEDRIRYPVLNLSLFKKNKLFVYSNLAAFINYCATAAVVVLLSLYLQYIKGYSPEKTGLIILAEPIIQSIFSPIMGRLSDKVEPRIIATAGMALNVVSLGLLSFVSEQTSDVIIILLLVSLGIGFALFLSPNTNIIMGSVEPKSYGVASATTNTMRTVGQAFSMAITTMILVFVMGKVVITPEYYPQLLQATKIAFTLFAVLCLVGTFFTAFRAKIRN
jgi:MFS family permease